MVIFNKNDLKKLIKITEKNIKDILNLNPYLKHKIISLKNDNIKELLFEMFNNMNKDKIPPNIVLEQTNDKNNFHYKENNLRFSLILLGDSGTGGKTLFLKKYRNGNCGNETLITIGIDKEKYYKMINKDLLIITLWDTSGQERFKCLPKKYYQNVDGIFLSFDVTDEDSFNNINNWLKDIYPNTNNKNFIIYLVGNKIDVINDRKISKEVAKSFAESKGMRYFESSAKYNINVREIINTMISEVYSNAKSMHFNFFGPKKENKMKLQKYLSY